MQSLPSSSIPRCSAPSLFPLPYPLPLLQDELKAIEKDIRGAVNAEVEEARKGSFPEPAALFEDIYWQEKPSFIRGATIEESIRA